jgi:hypothetical protein
VERKELHEVMLIPLIPPTIIPSSQWHLAQRLAYAVFFKTINASA